MNRKKYDESCPCGSGKSFKLCCEPIMNDTSTATSAEVLMRSRYTAYALRNKQYLLESWHSSTRPQSIDLDASVQWLRLEIINSGNDHVEFIATHRVHGKAYKMHENSHFVFEDGRRFYVDGEMVP